MRYFVILLSTLSLFGCAAKYEGPPPNLSLSNTESRKTELEKFKIDAPYFGWGWDMAGKTYYPSSLRPMMEKVSVRSKQSFKVSNRWAITGLSLLLPMIGSAIGSAVTKGKLSTGLYISFYSFAGLSILSSSIGAHYLGSAVDEYNEDLEERLGPRSSSP